MIVFSMVVLAALAGAVAGALGGRFLVFRQIGSVHGRGVFLNAEAAAQRANVASAQAEPIVAEWPGVLDRVERMSAQTQRFTLAAQAAEQRSLETAARMQELESAIASNFSITLNKGA